MYVDRYIDRYGEEEECVIRYSELSHARAPGHVAAAGRSLKLWSVHDGLQPSPRAFWQNRWGLREWMAGNPSKPEPISFW